MRPLLTSKKELQTKQPDGGQEGVICFTDDSKFQCPLLETFTENSVV